MKFNETEIAESILDSLEEMGFTEMTPIQEQAIPIMLDGDDIVGLAQTGTGKTAAFGISVIENINPGLKAVQGLVLCPTRELATQCATEIEKMSAKVKGINILAVYGGADIVRQLKILKSGRINLVIGTPGRVMDHMRRGSLKLDNLRMLVLDEADEMLNMGFREDIETILDQIPEDHQTALFSATMPDEIMEITRKYQRDAKLVEVSHDELTVPAIKQSYYMVRGNQKDEAICRLIDYMNPKRSLIFCNTKRKVDQLTLLLKRRGYSAEALHGDLAQQQRDRVMELFRSGNLDLLLATDVAARGIDVNDVDVVFNYDLPQEMEYYVHRIGRTGRAGKKGKAVSLINTREMHKLEALEKYCSTEIKEKIMPSYAEVMPIKANKNLENALEFCKGMDLEEYKDIVAKRAREDGVDPLTLAAAMLRESLGEARDEIEIGINHRRKSEAKAKKNKSGKRDNRESRDNRNGSRGGRHDRKNSDRDRSGYGASGRKASEPNGSDRKSSGGNRKKVEGRQNGKRSAGTNSNRGRNGRRTRRG